MPAETVAFVVEDVPSYRALRPVAEALDSGPVDTVEYLWVDRFYDPDSGKRIPREIRRRHRSRSVESFVRVDTPLATRFPDGPGGALAQKLLLDAVSHRPVYDTQGYLDAVEPDLVVAAMDSPPFVRHLIRDASDRGIPTAVLQHGFYPKNLDPLWLSERSGVLSPRFDPVLPPLERLKRRLGYRYGVTVYTNPWVDEVLTLGTFFQRRIRALREQYPCRGAGTVSVTGSPEYDGALDPYDPGTDSLLFLSQQQYEGGHWDDDRLDWVVERLAALDDHIDVTVRPHPKDSAAKQARYRERVGVSDEPDLATDVAAHDVVLTTHSTAVTEGVLQGKLSGVLELPWDDGVTHQSFPALRHRHLLRVRSDAVDFERAAAERSVSTQREYLRRYCFTPDAFDDGAGSSTEAILGRLAALVDGLDVDEVGVGLAEPARSR